MFSDNEHPKQMNNLTPNTMKTQLKNWIKDFCYMIAVVIIFLVTLYFTM